MNIYGKSDIGKVRDENQDSFGITELLPGVRLCVVCDGMGGYAGGSVASQIALETFTGSMREILTPDSQDGYPELSDRRVREALRDSVYAANSAVFTKSTENEDGSLDGMGTTLTALLITDSGYAWSVNVGDSRLYRAFPGEMIQLTHDHSVVQEYIDRGVLTREEARKSSMKNIITRAVGIGDWVEPDVMSVDIDPVDGVSGSLLLCSDGLYNCVTEERITAILNSSGEKTAEKADRLTRAARNAGGPDNITVIVIDL